MAVPLVLIHGYSDNGASFANWRGKLRSGSPAWQGEVINTCSYQSLTDEVTIKDLADGLDRALRAKFGDDEQQFDAIVHSTGMLVIREWFARDRRPDHPTARPSKVDRRNIDQLRDILTLAPQLAHALTREEHGLAACLDTRLLR